MPREARRRAMEVFSVATHAGQYRHTLLHVEQVRLAVSRIALRP
jgi:hypothetical protein